MNERSAIDVVVVGGGLAGLAGTLGLVRARRSVVVVDAGQPRNAPAAHAHGYLTRDGMPPIELTSSVAPRLGRMAAWSSRARSRRSTGCRAVGSGSCCQTEADGMRAACW